MRREIHPAWPRLTLVVIVAALVAAVGVSQESPYTEMTDRDIKALSPDQTRGYLEGDGMGLALAAELNGYPGPKHVLEMKQELGLSIQQFAEMRRIFDAMRSEAIELGRQILESERKLDESFVAGTIEEAVLVRLTEQIGRLNGRLRGVHLKAHLETVRVLSPHQRQKYSVVRGYAGHHGHDRGEHR